MNLIHDVIIVGAGPAGSLSAHLLSSSGFEVLVFEKQKRVKRKICGEYLCPLGVDLVRELKLDSLIQDFSDVKGMNIFSPKGRMLETKFPKTSKNNWGKSLNREVFDNSLIETAKASGANYIFESIVVSVIWNASYWSVEVLDKEGRHSVYKSRLLIAADGASSIICKKLNITTDKRIENKVAIHCWLKNKVEFQEKGQMHLFEDGSYIGLDPTGDSEINLSLVCDKNLLKTFKTTHELLRHYISKSECLKKQIPSFDDSVKVYVVTTLNHETKKVLYPNLALIGDAAGFIDPLTGEGIFNALWTSRQLCLEIIKNSNSFSYNKELASYFKRKVYFFRQKRILNYFFQWLITKNYLIEIVAKFLSQSNKRADSFVGIIGNIYKPIEGLIKILF